MRPRSPERQAVLDAARVLANGPLRGGTFKELGALAGVPVTRVQVLVQNAARAGELAPVASEPVHGRGRPMVRYAPACPGTYRASGGGHLQAVMSSWRPR